MQQVIQPLDQVGHMGLAVAMAIVLGLAFEGVYKREEHSSPGGIRTFPMLTVVGIALYLLEPNFLVPYVAGLAAVGIWLYAHIRGEPVRDTPRPGLMVPAANLLAYALGPVALTQPSWIVVATAVAAVLLLESREALHQLVLKIPSNEVFTLSKFLILVGIVLPLVPDHPIASWTPITPFKAWLALVAISSLSYASYLLQRYLPSRSGSLWSAVLGGAYSSTATTVALAVASGWVSGTFGQHGVYAIAALTGLTDIDPFVLSLAQGGVAGMSLHSLGAAILIAASSNNIIKAGYALVFGGARAAPWRCYTPTELETRIRTAQTCAASTRQRLRSRRPMSCKLKPDTARTWRSIARTFDPTYGSSRQPPTGRLGPLPGLIAVLCAPLAA